jgi:hypothetical protein
VQQAAGQAPPDRRFGRAGGAVDELLVRGELLVVSPEVVEQVRFPPQRIGHVPADLERVVVTPAADDVVVGGERLGVAIQVGQRVSAVDECARM